MIILKFLKIKFLILLFSIFISIILLTLFKPILTANDVIFPYSIHPFNISNDYPKLWLYIKIIFCLNVFIVSFLFINSTSSFIKINKKPKIVKTLQEENSEHINYIKLLVGINSDNNQKVFINEKGLYQNILVTGTIGSRQNQFCNVSFFKATHGV